MWLLSAKCTTGVATGGAESDDDAGVERRTRGHGSISNFNNIKFTFENS